MDLHRSLGIIFLLIIRTSKVEISTITFWRELEIYAPNNTLKPGNVHLHEYLCHFLFCNCMETVRYAKQWNCMERKIGFKHHTVKVSCPARMKTAMKLLICANNFLLPTGLATVIAITVTFCICECHQEKKIPYRPLENTNIIHNGKFFSENNLKKKKGSIKIQKHHR